MTSNHLHLGSAFGTTTRSTSIQRETLPRRGYALIFVLAIGVALGVLVGGLFAFLSESVTSSKQSQEELQQLYGCDGALRLAIHEVRRSGDVDIAKLQQRLGILSAALKSDNNPKSDRPFADIDGITVEPEAASVQVATNDPFHGLQFVQQASEFIVTANPEASRGRTCRAQSPNRLRTISYFQFAAVSNDVLTFGSGGLLGTPNTNGDVYTLQHPTSSRRSLGTRRSATPRSGFTQQDIKIADQETFRPVPPSGQPWSFINKKKRFFGGTKRRTRHKRPQLEYFVKYPTNTPSIDPTLSRFAMQADIRIVDGEWYIPDSTGNFPGRRIWSDGPSRRRIPGQFQYSAYETASVAGVNRARGGAAIIRYGLIGNEGGTYAPYAAGFCADPTDLGRVRVNETDDVVQCGSDAVDPATLTPFKDPLIAAASQGFFDPHRTSGGNRTPILPIILDVALLGAAMQTPEPGDLGEFRCPLDDDVLCPRTRRFKGAVWVGSLPSGMAFNGSPVEGNPHIPTGDANTQPCSLQTPVTTATVCARPNAVVLINAENLEAFTATGLSIGSNLPMYVVGSVNNLTPEVKRTSRIALMAPVITGLSSNFDFRKIAWSEGASSPPSSSETLDWVASIFTSWGTTNRASRRPPDDALRQIQGNLKINVTGSMVLMFRRGDYNKIQTFNTGRGSFSSPRADPIQTGIPTFEVNTDNPEEAGSRRAVGTLRYPGESTPVDRNLRRPKFDDQPPAAPRFSIDPAPIDRR